jgi:hypothetical protein
MTKGKHFKEFMLRGSNMNFMAIINHGFIIGFCGNVVLLCYYVLVLFVKVQLKQVLGQTYSWGRANHFLVLLVICAIFDAMRIDGAGETKYMHCRKEPESAIFDAIRIDGAGETVCMHCREEPETEDVTTGGSLHRWCAYKLIVCKEVKDSNVQVAPVRKFLESWNCIHLVSVSCFGKMVVGSLIVDDHVSLERALFAE